MITRGVRKITAKTFMDAQEEVVVCTEVHELLCEKLNASVCPDDLAIVSLGDDNEEPWIGSSKTKSFSSYRPVAFNYLATDAGTFVYSDKIYKTFIFHDSEKSCEQTESVEDDMFDDLCPIELRFGAPAKKFEDQGL